MTTDIQQLNKKIIAEFRANNGVVGGQFENMPILLLETVGAKSGARRVRPLAYFSHEDRHLIVGSFGGSPKNPPWYYNVMVNPEVVVEVGSEKYTAHAEVLDEPERTEMYSKLESQIPMFKQYRENIERTIPVVALNRSKTLP